MKSKILSLILLFIITISVSAQTLDVNKMTKEQVLELTYDELLDLPFDDLLKLADIVGVSADELLQMAISLASKKSESLFDTPLSASVISGEDIENAGATSIMEALRLVPGVIVREQTPGNYDIHLRGFDDLDPNGLISFTRNAITLVMINNRIVYNEFQGNTYWELLQISVDDVERIEVVRGTTSAMYGPNAVSGVINIITKKASNNKGLHASTYSQAGTHHTLLGNLAVSYASDNGFSVRVAGNYDYRKRHNVDYYILSGLKYKLDENHKIIGVEHIENGFVDDFAGTELNIGGAIPTDPDKDPSIPIPNYNERYPYKDLAIDKKSANMHLAYNKENFNINLMGGLSTAKDQNSFAINNFGALSTDSVNNHFAHLWGNYKNFSFSADYNGGDLETLGSGGALQADYNIFNLNAEYSYDILDNLNIRPGVSYRHSIFNGRILGSTMLDNNFNSIKRDGDHENFIISGFLRTEYRLNKFRFIGAIRADKFKYPNKLVINPLLVTTFKANDNWLFRASYGSATRSPFMINLFTNLDMTYPMGTTPKDLVAKLEAGGVTFPYTTYYGAHYRGTEYQDKDYNLMTVQNFEIGARHNFTDWLSADFGIFYSKMKNLDVFAKVARSLTIDAPTSPTGKGKVLIDDTTSFVDINIKPEQLGGTFSVFAKPIKNLSMHLFVTIQQTKVYNHYDSTGYKSYIKAPGMSNHIYVKGESANVIDSKKDADNNAYKDFTHKATPTFYGGFNINYKPINKLNININGYFYGKQTFSIAQGNGKDRVVEDIKSNFITNATVSYEVYKGIDIFINARNLTGANKRQFAITDKIGTVILGGLKMNL